MRPIEPNQAGLAAASAIVYWLLAISISVAPPTQLARPLRPVCPLSPCRDKEPQILWKVAGKCGKEQQASASFSEFQDISTYSAPSSK